MLNRLKRLYAKRNSTSYIEYLRSQGMRIGEGTVVHSLPSLIVLDTTRPWLIEIGKNVKITNGVKILTHGYDWAAIKASTGEVLGSAGKVKIGDNCFIGMNAVILKGTTIGNNVIIGAGSLVTGGEYPSNCVIAGNPARVICSLEDYKKKRLAAQKKEARELVLEYYKVYGKKPTKNILSEFFWLFEERKEITESSFLTQMRCMNNYDVSLDRFMNTEPVFNGYDEFLNYCFGEDV